MSAKAPDIKTSAFAGLPVAEGGDRGVIVMERGELAIARIAALRAQAAAVAEHFRARFGLECPDGPRRASRGAVGIAGIGPETWLATCEQEGGAFVASLQSLLSHCAAVSDQSDAFVMLRLAGPKVRETLAKLVPIDIHHRIFRVGDVARTLCGYIGVTLWRMEDSVEGDPVFDVWAGRSFAISLHHVLAQAAADFGFARGPVCRTTSLETNTVPSCRP